MVAKSVFESAFNKYELQSRIGSGGSGVVYEATDVEGQHVAVKAIDPSKATTIKLKRFQNEIRFCERNSHLNIVRVLDHGRGPEGQPFYVMPLYTGTLADVMRKGIVAAEVLKLFSQVLDGTEAAHLMHVVHRDLKPQNILWDQPTGRLAVADFGIASFEEEELYTAVETQKNDRLANFQYAAPEQRARDRDVTSKADIFALGLILNEMFTQEILQGTSFKTISAVAKDYGYLDAIVDSMVRQDPAQRPSIADIKRELLARREQFVSLQKIDQLSHEVVSETKIDDPLVVNPVQVTTIDYAFGRLALELSSPPNGKWIEEFHNQGNVTSFLGHGPQTVYFQGKQASMDVSGLQERSLQQQVDYFRNWIGNANQLYARRIEREAADQRRLRQQQLEKQLAEERKRERILSTLK